MFHLHISTSFGIWLLLTLIYGPNLFFFRIFWVSAANILSIFLTFLGSSSSALGLQSLGLSGQAPSSSSLDAGTLSDTTASGNKTVSIVSSRKLGFCICKVTVPNKSFTSDVKIFFLFATLFN